MNVQKMNVRIVAVRILQQVVKGQSLTKVFDTHLATLPNQQHPFVKALCFGVLRHYFHLQASLKPQLKKPLKAKDGDIQLLLLCALYELKSMDTADYAAVSEAVNATKGLKKPWARGLVNAVLRHFLRHPDANPIGEEDAQAYFNHPQWMIDAIRHDWPQHWQQILNANNTQPPLLLRVNRLQTSVKDYLAVLAAHNIPATAHPGADFGVHISHPIDTTQLPGFAEGWFSVQDGAAQQAAQLLDLHPGQTVLDACAAPGGKTCLILETEPKIKHLLAVDQDPDRSQHITQNLVRLQLQNTAQVQIQAADFTTISEWWDGPFFDRILLDAPCTGSGVIRRHPDIKMLRIEDDVVALSQRQLKMLEVAWSVLNSGGRLLYATCSIFKVENEQLIAHFLQQHTDVHQHHSVRCLPGEQGNDGFYYACLDKE